MMSDLEVDSVRASSELALVRRLALAALEALERERQRIDGLNIYPVPDGDTGMNLVLTVRALVEELDASEPVEQAVFRRDFARALLMRARGTSGVILSQIVRGLCDVWGRSADLTTADFKEALCEGATSAYRAVKEPVEGTLSLIHI